MKLPSLLALLAAIVAGGSTPAEETLVTANQGSETSRESIAADRSFSLDDLPAYRHQGISKTRLALVMAGVGVYDVAFYQTLKKPWWSGAKAPMHLTNDWWNGYAMEVDKAAHAFAGQSMARVAAGSYQWAGMTRKQALFWGGVTSLTTLSQVEILDGYTRKFGFSTADYVANIAGAFFPLAQEMWRPLQCLTFKMSYHPKPFEEHGNDGNLLEDYDRQTFWLTLRPTEILPEQIGRLVPPWLGVAFGYGVENAFSQQGRMREYYLSLDIDPTRANLGDGWVAKVIAPVRYVHLPSPAIRFREDGTRFFALYF